MHEVPRHTGEKRLDRYLSQLYPDISFSQWQKWLRTGQLRVNGKRAKGQTMVRDGDVLRLPPFVNNSNANASYIPDKNQEKYCEQIHAMQLYEDEAVLVLNKPAGLAVQGGSGQTRHLDGLLRVAYGDAAPRLVHRLDKDTSGVLLLAKTPAAATQVTAQFRDCQTTKRYWACVEGVPAAEAGVIDAPLMKAGLLGQEQVRVTEAGKPARTHYKLLAVSQDGQLSWLELRPQTGRMHQLRVHCAFLHTPIYGDGKYGTARRGVALHLHAQALTFQSPATGQWQTVTAPLPPAMLATWALCGWQSHAMEGT